jgi:predicted phosphodiesterase
MPLDPIQRMARNIIARHPDHPARSIARALVAKCKGAITLDAARSRVRRELSANYANGRKAPAFKRAPRAAGETLAPPVSIAKPWLRFEFPAAGPIGILSDIHIPYHSNSALAAAIATLKRDKVRGILINGDAVDFYSISRWEKNPAERDFKRELQQAREFFAWLRQEFRRIPIVLKTGNHEERWSHWLFQHAPEISDMPEMGLDNWLHLKQHGIDLVEDQRPVMLGKLTVLHGHELPRQLASPVNAARGAWVRTKTTVLVGHHHRTSGHSEPNMWHEETFSWSCGCLADLTPAYSVINSWNHGFAICDVAADGSFDVHNYRIADGAVRSS